MAIWSVARAVTNEHRCVRTTVSRTDELGTVRWVATGHTAQESLARAMAEARAARKAGL